MAVAVVIDQDQQTPATIRQMLGAGHVVLAYHQGALAADFVCRHHPDVVFLSLDVEDVDGLELLADIRRRASRFPVVALCRGTPARRIADAVREGACDVLPRPFVQSELRESLRRALVPARRARPVALAPIPELVGISDALVRVCERICRIAPLDVPVLITGESGVGKELVAGAIHRLSPRSNGPLHARNCGAIPDSLFESELFGTERGAYTDAVRRPGAFGLADGGSLFLDEIGELSPPAQVKLLRAIEHRVYLRVGGSVEQTTRARLILATNRDLLSETQTGRFRPDFYYRVAVYRIDVPPLRERREDIPLLVEHLVRKLEQTVACAASRSFGPDALAVLSGYAWPGNVRELKNVVTRSVLTSDSPVIRATDLQFD